MASLPRYSTAPLLPLLLGPIRLLLFPFAYVCDPDSNRPFFFFVARRRRSRVRYILCLKSHRDS